MEQIEALVELLFHKDNSRACGAMRALEAESEKSNAVYAHFDALVQLLSNQTNSYHRNRALVLIAANARWDGENRINAMIDDFLSHITDKNPITARQCLHVLPQLAHEKPALRAQILAALHRANPIGYAESMRPLIEQDIRDAIAAIGQDA